MAQNGGVLNQGVTGEEQERRMLGRNLGTYGDQRTGFPKEARKGKQQ